MKQRMTALATLAGWSTVPVHTDHTVVRLALTEAKARHNPDAGGNADLRDLVHDIEDAWLQEVL
jgi:hypothetical protein